MPKRFRCREMGWKCGYIMTAPTMTELTPRVEEHLRTGHNLAVIPRDIRFQMEGAIHEVPERKRPTDPAPLSAAPASDQGPPLAPNP